jgi:hypothetical protein
VRITVGTGSAERRFFGEFVAHGVALYGGWTAPLGFGGKMNAALFRLPGLIILLVVLAACTAYDHDTSDTAANLEGFECHFGFAAPPDVTDVYYFADEMGADVLYQLGFEAGPETVARIVSALGLAQTASEEIGLGLAYTFPWWDEQDIQQATLYWKSSEDQDYWWALWYSEATGRIYYLEYSR